MREVKLSDIDHFIIENDPLVEKQVREIEYKSETNIGKVREMIGIAIIYLERYLGKLDDVECEKDDYLALSISCKHKQETDCYKPAIACIVDMMTVNGKFGVYDVSLQKGRNFVSALVVSVNRFFV